MSEPGLRERKKTATREAISRAALLLAAARGLDAVTGDAIAEAADVSPRTFRNYFGGKEEAILYSMDVVERRLLEFVAHRGSDEPILDCMEAALVELIESPDCLEPLLIARSLVLRYPRLRAHLAASEGAYDYSHMLREIGRRTNADPDRDVYPRVVLHSVHGVLNAALAIPTDTAPEPAALVHRIRVGFDNLRNGFTRPGKES